MKATCLASQRYSMNWVVVCGVQCFELHPKAGASAADTLWCVQENRRNEWY